jgi:hypothetical protein
MFSQRLIAAADMSALGAAAQMKPPAIRGNAFDAAGARWWRVGIDALFGHDLGFETRPQMSARGSAWPIEENGHDVLSELGYHLRLRGAFHRLRRR